MTEDTAPAIVRDYDSDKDDVPVISTPTDSVSFKRGWGDSGYRVEVVEHDCPSCQFDRMIRRVDVSPEFPTEVRYWCLNPNCQHYASDNLSHACKGSYPYRSADEPTIFEERGDA
jgi:hypothetical protein